MEYKDGAPEGEVPPTHCPVCLESWDTKERLPKFLSCHHSVCITCAGRLRRPSPASVPARRTSQSPNTPTSPLARLMGSRVAPATVSDSTKPEESFWVRCPLCRTSTPVQDPAALQTNFYLWGLLRVPSVPRLVLWCESCNRVAAPECSDHHLRPFPEKLRLLQEELVERAEEERSWTRGRIGEYRRQVEVYRWLCGLLRHAHARVLDSLTHAQHTHRVLHHHNQDLLALVTSGEVLQKSQEPEEKVVAELVRAGEEVAERHQAVVGEANTTAELLRKFPVMPSHRGPQGYGRARVVLDASETVMLCFYGEEEYEDDELDLGQDKSSRSRRSSSLSDSSRRKGSARQKERSRSFLQPKTRPANQDLHEESNTSDNLASRTSTPSIFLSPPSLCISEVNVGSVYDEERSIAVPSVAASTPPLSLQKKSLKKTERDASPPDMPSMSFQDAVHVRRSHFQEESDRPRRPRGRGARRHVDREHRMSSTHRRSRQARCSVM